MEKNESFDFTYNAQQQEEIRRIREKYLPPQEDKMERLRKLHQSAYTKAQIRAISLGTLGALLLGTGMSLCMTELGAVLGSAAFFLGILVGVVGLVLAALAYPAYERILKKERERIAPEILRLSEELLQ